MPLQQSERRSQPEPSLGTRERARPFPLDLPRVDPPPIDLPHVVVCTQDLGRVSPLIQMLIAAGYIVTTYPSSSRLFPRLHKIPHPIELLVIDGSADVPFARSALLRARAAFVELPIMLLSHAETDLGHEATHLGANRVVYLPLQNDELLDAAFSLAPSPAYATARSISSNPIAGAAAADQPCC
jgi:hypothetical protein